MTDFTLVDPKGWEYDLHSVYSAYIGYFQIHNIPWFERTWGHLFTSFEEFLAFSWPVITVTDAFTGRAHIVTRLNSVGAFLKMIKTRFGETLPQAPNILQVTPFEIAPRHLRNISDYATYKKLYSTLPAAVIAAQRTRVRAGEPKAIKELWAKREKTFLALGFVWSERNEKSCLEFGYAAVRCGHIEASGHWPPNPDTNYRKGHYIVEEYVDRIFNKHPPNHPWQYAFGESQLTPKTKLPQIIQAVISSFISPDSETSSNTVVLVGHGTHGQVARLEEMRIKIPHNVLMIDIASFERSLYSTGERGAMVDPKTERGRLQSTTLSFENLLRSLPVSQSSPNNSSMAPGSNPKPAANSTSDLTGPSPPSPPRPSLPQCTLSNAGNEAVMSLFALQMLLDPSGTRVPTIKKSKPGNLGHGQSLSMANLNTMNISVSMGQGMNMGVAPMMMYGVPPMTMVPPMVPGVGATVPGMSGAPVPINGGTGLNPSSPTVHGNGVPHGLADYNNSSVRGRMRASVYDLASEFGQMQVSATKAQSGGSLLSPGLVGPARNLTGGAGSSRAASPFFDMEKNKRKHSHYPAATWR